MRPRLLDAFCCQGGAAAGYVQAGFDVVGVDIDPQPRFPFEFVQADAVRFIAEHGREFDAIHASPPCQAYSSMGVLSDNEHPELVAPTREVCISTGRPYVIENVEGAPLPGALMLCGSEFGLGATCRDGVWRQLRRHRLFESNVFLMGAGGCCHVGQPLGVYGTGGGGQMTRGYKSYPGEDAEALRIDWADRYGLSQAIPPAFTNHVGEQLLAALAVPAAVEG